MTEHDALDAADALVLTTAHSSFASLDVRKTIDTMRTAIIVDGHRLFDPEITVTLGFIYTGVGAENG